MSRAHNSLYLSHEDIEELAANFKSIDVNGNGFIELEELNHALSLVGLKIPQWRIRQMIDEMEKDKDGFSQKRLSFQEFQKLYGELKAKEVGSTFKRAVSKRENLETLGGMSEASSEGTTHSVRLEEQLAFSDWVNSNLGSDPDLRYLLPIDFQGKQLYDKVKDGILLCKVINYSCPNTIDERAINKKNLTVYTKYENLTLALTSAQSIGCNVISIDAHDLTKGKPHLVLGLLWQIIRIGLFNQITLEHCPGLPALLLDGEQLDQLTKISPEMILIRWVNYHLQKAGINRKLTNFTSDVRDSIIYTHLLHQIAPPEYNITLGPLSEPRILERAELMLQQAERMKCRTFVTPSDVVDGVYKLNLAFVANLFNQFPALQVTQVDTEIPYPTIEETREEKTYRNWMNSMGVTPYVNCIYSDLADGLVIFQLCDIIRPNLVNWDQVHRQFAPMKRLMQQLENCNYAVSLGKKLNFSLVGIGGQDLLEGNITLTLALVWQLMRAYTLSVLTQLAGTGHPIIEKEIVEWSNNKLASVGKPNRIKSFQDPALADSRIILDLIDAIRAGAVNYELVNNGDTPEKCYENARYAISVARKIGAHIYALPEDICEVKPKMVMTVFACLMALEYIPKMQAKS